MTSHSLPHLLLQCQVCPVSVGQTLLAAVAGGGLGREDETRAEWPQKGGSRRVVFMAVHVIGAPAV